MSGLVGSEVSQLGIKLLVLWWVGDAQRDASRWIRAWRGRRQTGSGWRRIIADRFKLKAASALFPVRDCRVRSISYADGGAINNIPL